MHLMKLKKADNEIADAIQAEMETKNRIWS